MKLSQPLSERLAKAKEASQRSVMDHDLALKRLDAILPMPSRKLPARDITAATLLAVSRWAHTQKDYGVQINDSEAVTQEGGTGQSAQPLEALQTRTGISNVQVQTILLKGQYVSIEGLQEFVKEQMVAEYASVSSLKLSGKNFEMTVQIFGLKPIGDQRNVIELNGGGGHVR
jgi:uncharacterized membrane protein